MKQVMNRKAADNKYLHRDFHTGGDNGIAYLGERYGDNAVDEYLTTFAKRFYSPLVAKIKEQGLSAMADHIKDIYEKEEASDALTMELTGDRLEVKISYCPAVRYMKSQGHEPSKWYVEFTRKVNMVIADEADIGFVMDFYNPEDGSAAYRFFKRAL